MRIAHLLRKYNPAEWGGTETVIHQLFTGLRRRAVGSVVYCPSIPENRAVPDPLMEAGCTVRRFNAWVPVWGVTAEQKRQMVAVGGNLMSFDLIRALWREPGLSVIHTHALGRVGGIGLTLARRRKIPFVVTVHGGVYDLPDGVRQSLHAPAGGVEWGKPFGLLLRSRRVLTDADAILTCNRREAALLRQRHPDRRVIVQPHGVPAARYEPDRREEARAAFPAIAGRAVLLAVGRIDPVKNQGWLVEQLPELSQRHPNVLLVLAGACTDEAYGERLRARIEHLGLGGQVVLTGKLPPADPRLIGLLQEARVAVLPSLSETFGLVILEAWAAGTPVVSSRTSGASGLIEHEKNGWLFDLERPRGFHAAIDRLLSNEDSRRRAAAAGHATVVADYDADVIAGRMQQLYEILREEKHAVYHSA